MTQCWTHQTSLSLSFTALLLFCSCDIVCCRLGCFRSAVTSLHTCTHYLTPAFKLGSHVSKSFIRNESNVRMIYKSHQIHVHSSIGSHVSRSFTSFMYLTKFMSSTNFKTSPSVMREHLLLFLLSTERFRERLSHLHSERVSVHRLTPTDWSWLFRYRHIS